MRQLAYLLAGIIVGAASWSLGALLSGRFEPFDSAVGFATTQLVLSGATLLTAWRSGGKPFAALWLGGYCGLNLYPYIFGGAESRAWAPLGAVTTWSLMAVPLLAGLVGVAIRRVW